MPIGRYSPPPTASDKKHFMAKTDRDIPHNLQPRASDYGFDLEACLRSVVGLRADIPGDAFTAGTLGTERAGNGICIRGGLVLTMAYLVTEADTIWLSTADGWAVPGHALAVDFETGFGLVQPLGRLGVPELAIGDSNALEIGAPALLAAAGGRQRTIETQVVGRQEFAGYWEYLIDDALFTAPAHPFWGGAGLIGADGRLLGVGSLILQQGDEKGRRVDMNMVVPTALLTPILDELVQHGRVNRPARPWLGLYAMESEDAVVVGGVSDGGPADKAGLRAGDRIVAVDGDEVTDLGSLWRRVWSAGTAGARVRMSIGRDDELLHVTIHSADRSSFLRAPRLH
jgi:S1-C subfamily serine protease